MDEFLQYTRFSSHFSSMGLKKKKKIHTLPQAELNKWIEVRHVFPQNVDKKEKKKIQVWSF